MTPIQDRPFDGWQRVAELRLDTILLRDAEILSLAKHTLKLSEDLTDARAEINRLRLAAGLEAVT